MQCGVLLHFTDHEVSGVSLKGICTLNVFRIFILLVYLCDDKDLKKKNYVTTENCI